MPRRREVPKRKIIPDPLYGDRMVAKFMNVLMWDGKKNTAERVVYGAFDILDARGGEDDPLKVFKKALDNVKPMIEVKSRRVGGATYQVPMEVRPERRTALAMRWLIKYAEKEFWERGFFFADSTIFDVFDFSLIRGNPRPVLPGPHHVVISESVARKFFGEDDPKGG